MLVAGDVYERMLFASRLAAPREAVGLVFGSNDRAAEFVGLTNVSLVADRFALDETEVDRVIESETREPIGFFHSHPTDIAAPSAADIHGAEAWPRKYHFILSLREKARLTCWLIFDGQAVPEPVILEDVSVAAGGIR